MPTENAYSSPPVPRPLKGPGTNSAQILSHLLGTDSERADTVAAHMENGLDFAAVLANVAASGRGGFISAPTTATDQPLDDTVYTELTGTRVRTPAAGGLLVFETQLLFSATALGVDITDLRVGTSGLQINQTWVEYTATAGGRAVDVVTNLFSNNPHTVVMDVPVGLTMIRFNAICATSPGADFWIECKTDSDIPGVGSFRGGIIRGYVAQTDGEFIGASSTP